MNTLQIIFLIVTILPMVVALVSIKRTSGIPSKNKTMLYIVSLIPYLGVIIVLLTLFSLRKTTWTNDAVDDKAQLTE